MTGHTKNHGRGFLGEFSGLEKRILMLTCPAHFTSHMFILVFPAVAMPLVNTLGLPLEEVVKISFFMYLFYGLCALPVGVIVDKWQAKGMLVIGQITMGVGLASSGIYPNSSLMPYTLALVGIGASTYHPTGLSLISRTVRQRGHALGINGVFGNLGISAAPLVTGLLTWLLSWQLTFIILGTVCIFIAFLLSTLKIDESPRTEVHRSTSKEINYTRYFVILCFAMIFGGLSYRGNMLLLPAYLELKTTFFLRLIEAFPVTKTQGTATLAATVLTSAILLSGIFGQITGGRLADRKDLRYAYLFVHLASVPFLLAMAFVTNYLLAFCAAAYVFFSLGMQPIENSLIAAFTPVKWRSTSFAVKFILNFGVGATVVYLIGAVKQAYSLEIVYMFLAGFAFLIVSSVVVLIVASRQLKHVRN
ncbi:MAG: MFS transporter [Candidatus Latescibacteria bacterium]|nr:MFS transporter [Candidatus Latescibacterota bacterium]NIM66427.1 MFS transporter [Candidatus Latescibacterota bacterium]NIO02907.1 MFS transporter [Candidatus Latescibacterota bacterium]NIO30042.1 MFS transporter [Candidatus Latescibacterota bacterium]NIO57657.1 MFS transporter [Candidatus Latescibacterota bacterium]